MSWFVSNCRTQSRREEYFAAIGKYISIDKFGECGKKIPCGRRDYGKDCTNHIVRKYKFYFAAENTLCKDYFTEKLFRPLNSSAIPVVFAAGGVHKVAPPHSYIDVRDFKSPKHLADYLLYLDKNDTAYMAYFNWKRDYEVKPGRKSLAYVFCQMCKYMHTNSTSKIYSNFTDWFFRKSECKDPYGEIHFS